MNDGSAKQQIVEHIKNASNILVSVSTDPSVDSLSAALSLTMMLNKMDKHATAVFSGTVPPAISFLEPEKTFEGTVNSLRDFIIALDKDKASRLRTKVEDEVVRIFVTPYHTSITENDLQFSQGDFNVDLVIALGVDRRETLDQAIVAHGRILHDATVVTINANDQRSSLGSVDWNDMNASSLCEMLMSLSEALQPGLIDEPTATALLTGIVSATERFANRHTSPKVMTMSAQLMAAGANQQLIATKLEEGEAIKPAASKHDSTTDVRAGTKTADAPKEEAQSIAEPAPKKAGDGEMLIDHETAAPAPSLNLPAPEVPQAAVNAAEDALEEALASNGTPAAKPNLQDLDSALEAEAAEQTGPALPDPAPAPEPEQAPAAPAPEPLKPKSSAKPTWMGDRLEPPRMGGTLNAIGEEALEEKLRQEERDRNQGLLSHGHNVAPPAEAAEAPQPQTSFNSFGINYEEAPLPEPVSFEPAPEPQEEPASQPQAPDTAPAPAQPAEPAKTLAELEAEAHAKSAQQLAAPADNVSSDLDQARNAVSEALDSMPAAPEAPTNALTEVQHVPEPPTPPPLPPMPDFSTLPPLPPQPTGAPEPLPEPRQEENQLTAFPEPPQPPTLPDAPAGPSDPAQFRIPGQ